MIITLPMLFCLPTQGTVELISAPLFSNLSTRLSGLVLEKKLPQKAESSLMTNNHQLEVTVDSVSEINLAPKSSTLQMSPNEDSELSSV